MNNKQNLKQEEETKVSSPNETTATATQTGVPEPQTSQPIVQSK